MTKFYDVHVFFSRKDGYSVFIQIETEDEFVRDEDVIEEAIKQGKLDECDANQIDYVSEIEEEDFIQMTKN